MRWVPDGLRPHVSTYLEKCNWYDQQALGEVLLSCVNRWLCYLQEKMDQTIYLLQNTDPADASPDGPELITLEGTRKTLPELLFNVDYIYVLGWGVQTKYDIIRNFRSCHYMALQNTLFLWTIYMFPGFSETEFIKVVIAVKYIFAFPFASKAKEKTLNSISTISQKTKKYWYIYIYFLPLPLLCYHRSILSQLHNSTVKCYIAHKIIEPEFSTE